MQSLIQINFAVVINKHQSLKTCQHFLFSYWLFFTHLSSLTINYCRYPSMKCSNQISQETVKCTYMYPITSFKAMRFSQKQKCNFSPLKRSTNMSHLHRGMLQLEKLPAIEITEYPAFTECKLDIFYLHFCGKWYLKWRTFIFLKTIINVASWRFGAILSYLFSNNSWATCVHFTVLVLIILFSKRFAFSWQSSYTLSTVVQHADHCTSQQQNKVLIWCSLHPHYMY